MNFARKILRLVKIMIMNCKIRCHTSDDDNNKDDR